MHIRNTFFPEDAKWSPDEILQIFQFKINKIKKKLLVILFLLKLYPHISIFNYIDTKHGQIEIKFARVIQK